MDDYFNYDVAEWLYDSVSKMDDDEAEMVICIPLE